VTEPTILQAIDALHSLIAASAENARLFRRYADTSQDDERTLDLIALANAAQARADAGTAALNELTAELVLV